MPNMYTLVAPCFFGTEHTLSFEVKRLGAQNVKVTDGRVAFEGDAAMIAAANLNLRTAERVLLLLKTFPAATFDELFDGVYSIPWEELIPVDAQFPVKGSSLSSQLSSVPACQSIVKKAIVKRLQYGHKTTTLPETGALYKIRFALRKNVVEVMLDTSGDGLHKRGYRKNATLAPIKETLAATIADVGFVRRDSTVQDPFCGSGTLVIEAAQKALNIAPGLRRRFAAEHYDFVPAAVWAEERQKALAASRLDAGFEGFGFDIDPNAVALANANAKLAGVGDRCRFEVADVKDFAPRPSSIILTNPPYGERLGDAAEAAAGHGEFPEGCRAVHYEGSALDLDGAGKSGVRADDLFLSVFARHFYAHDGLYCGRAVFGEGAGKVTIFLVGEDELYGASVQCPRLVGQVAPAVETADFYEGVGGAGGGFGSGPTYCSDPVEEIQRREFSVGRRRHSYDPADQYVGRVLGVECRCVFIPYVKPHYGIAVYIEVSRDGEVLHAGRFLHCNVLSDIVPLGRFADARRVTAKLDFRVCALAADVDGAQSHFRLVYILACGSQYEYSVGRTARKREFAYAPIGVGAV